MAQRGRPKKVKEEIEGQEVETEEVEKEKASENGVKAKSFTALTNINCNGVFFEKGSTFKMENLSEESLSGLINSGAIG